MIKQLYKIDNYNKNNFAKKKYFTNKNLMTKKIF